MKVVLEMYVQLKWEKRHFKYLVYCGVFSNPYLKCSVNYIRILYFLIKRKFVLQINHVLFTMKKKSFN